jgi:hypothetical protein
VEERGGFSPPIVWKNPTKYMNSNIRKINYYIKFEYKKEKKWGYKSLE